MVGRYEPFTLSDVWDQLKRKTAGNSRGEECARIALMGLRVPRE